LNSMDRESLVSRVQDLTAGLNEIVASLGNSSMQARGELQTVIQSSDDEFQNNNDTIWNSSSNDVVSADCTAVPTTIDAGGSLRAYIWTLVKKALISNVFVGVPIFEGEMNHLIPVHYAFILNDEVFYALGGFLGFSILNACVGFVGISSIVSNFLVSETDDSFLLEECLCKGNVALLGNVQGEVRDVLLDSGFTYPLQIENVLADVKHLKMYSVVTIRKEELIQMKTGFQSTEFSKWLSCNRSLASNFFQKQSRIKPSVSEIITAFGFIDVSCSLIQSYVQLLVEDFGRCHEYHFAFTHQDL
ncbi:unnamed protein product, partial [Allacma fusca]